jgi:D-alanyl-D-alanine carboxypeptidase
MEVPVRRWFRTWLLVTLTAGAPAATALETDAPLRARIDEAVGSVLAASGAPSASIAVVKDGKIAYENAYGWARLDPKTKATSAMRYSIGSVSKQFTASAVLLLAEQGRLSLDDKVARWLPELTRANEVTVRELLSMTAGYQDYWPQDYVFPAMLEPTTPPAILERWAKKALDFEPGTKWQYSNTNYVIAGQVVERAGGRPLLELLRERVFTPLGMSSVRDVDAEPLGAEDAAGYLRNALGPLRPAPKEARGWLSAAGELGMTAHDLALWDISLIEQSVLRPASYRALETAGRLANGTSSGYGLGVHVGSALGRRFIAHGGAVSGYLTANVVRPDDRGAVVVFVNAYPGASGAEFKIADLIAKLVFERADADASVALERAKGVFAAFQQGKLDRSLLSPNANAYFTTEVVADFASSLGPLGPPTEFVETQRELRGGMSFRAYRVGCGSRTLNVTTRTLPDGRLEQYLVEPAE